MWVETETPEEIGARLATIDRIIIGIIIGEEIDSRTNRIKVEGDREVTGRVKINRGTLEVEIITEEVTIVGKFIFMQRISLQR